MYLFLQENHQRSSPFGVPATIYQTALKVENDGVQRWIRRFALTGILIVLALSPARMDLMCQSPQQPSPSKDIAAPEDRVDINSASLDQLLKVPGMTRTWAMRIVRFRPYRGKNELLDRGIVSSEVYNRIKDYIVAHRSAQ